MHPELFRFSVFGLERPIYSYGAMVVLGIAITVLIAVARARRYGLERFDELAVVLMCVAGGLLGGALLYLGVHVREVVAQPVLLLGPGLVFYGGVLGGALAAWLYARRFGVPLARAFDAGVPGLAFGHAIGRIGCFLGGCCFGRPCAPRFALGVPLHGALRHPVPLYEASALVLLGALLLAISRPLRSRPGALAALYVALYAALRLSLEPLRGDDLERGIFAGLSTSQWLGGVALAASITALFTRPRAALMAKGAS